MGYRVKQFPPRNGWYVVLDVQAWAMEAMGCSNVIKKKLGDTKSEATANAVQFVAKEQRKWEVKAGRRGERPRNLQGRRERRGGSNPPPRRKASRHPLRRSFCTDSKVAAYPPRSLPRSN